MSYAKSKQLAIERLPEFHGNRGFLFGRTQDGHLLRAARGTDYVEAVKSTFFD